LSATLPGDLMDFVYRYIRPAKANGSGIEGSGFHQSKISVESTSDRALDTRIRLPFKVEP
jgi:hypothetical protein